MLPCTKESERDPPRHPCCGAFTVAGMDAADVARLIDPEIGAMLEQFPFPPIDNDTMPIMREAMAAPVGDLSDRVTRSIVHAPAKDGSPEVVLRVHRPVDAVGSLPCLVWMHGGGLVLGVAGQDDGRFDAWCVRHNMMAVSVEYRLAPETPFPGPIEDCYAGLRYVAEHAGELGVDPNRIGVGGASAGAGLAASLALLARDRGGPLVSSQLLIYPMIDDRQITESSSWNVPVWPASSNTFGWTSYLGDTKGTDGVSPYAAAARATDLSGLPPAIILVGGLDGFVDEDIDYARRLNQVGVPVEFHLYPGAPHGFDALLPNSSVAQRANADMKRWLDTHYGEVSSFAD